MTSGLLDHILEVEGSMRPVSAGISAISTDPVRRSHLNTQGSQTCYTQHARGPFTEQASSLEYKYISLPRRRVRRGALGAESTGSRGPLHLLKCVEPDEPWVVQRRHHEAYIRRAKVVLTG